jgi:hypothetical protein
VLRGDYGIFYFVDRGGIDNQLSQNPPFGGSASVNASDGFRITLGGEPPLNSTDTRLATAPLPSAATVNNISLTNPQGLNVFSLLPTNRNSYVQEWNTQIQQEITPNTALTIAYVGNKGTKLAQVYNTNRVPYGADPNNSASKLFPNLGDVVVESTNGSSIYPSLQTQLEHRFSHGVQFTASYTWSHATDDAVDVLDRGSGNCWTSAICNWNAAIPARTFVIASCSRSVAELPFGRGRMWATNMPGAAEAVLGGWQVNPDDYPSIGIAVRPRRDLTGQQLHRDEGWVRAAPGATKMIFGSLLDLLVALPSNGDQHGLRASPLQRCLRPGDFIESSLFKLLNDCLNER